MKILNKNPQTDEEFLACYQELHEANLKQLETEANLFEKVKKIILNENNNCDEEYQLMLAKCKKYVEEYEKYVLELQTNLVEIEKSIKEYSNKIKNANN